MVVYYNRHKSIFRKENKITVEGIHWEFEDDGVNTRALPVGPENEHGDAFGWGSFRNAVFQKRYSDNNSEDFRRAIDNCVDRELVIPASTFLFDNEGVKTEAPCCF